LMPFLWDIRPGRYSTAVQNGHELKLGPTSSNGISSDLITLQNPDTGPLAEISVQVPDGTQGILNMHTFFAEEEGWGLISGLFATVRSCGGNLPADLGASLQTSTTRSK
jgi:hypothetical protein